MTFDSTPIPLGVEVSYRPTIGVASSGSSPHRSSLLPLSSSSSSLSLSSSSSSSILQPCGSISGSLSPSPPLSLPHEDHYSHHHNNHSLSRRRTLFATSSCGSPPFRSVRMRPASVEPDSRLLPDRKSVV
eukprot:TRINITY_DN243_c1_g2_i6.p1 TRINITY_DN243_c1_g2~~TRINITY_DN243_c1_g2_i6.p1  ORF type:complete len:130 (+),score=33.69 TRINITY_DN243_c1_g2_i6:424-813(+)